MSGDSWPVCVATVTLLFEASSLEESPGLGDSEENANAQNFVIYDIFNFFVCLGLKSSL
jgi:hypothetical protein